MCPEERAMQELAVGWESSGKKRKMDPRILMSGMKEADGCRMTNAGEEGEHRSFLAIILSPGVGSG